MKLICVFRAFFEARFTPRKTDTKLFSYADEKQNNYLQLSFDATEATFPLHYLYKSQESIIYYKNSEYCNNDEFVVFLLVK